MGFFSYQCAKSQKPVMNIYAVGNGPYAFSSRVVVLFKNGDRISGSYDGYGRVGGVELVDFLDSDFKVVISKYYNGESFDQLGPNKHEPGQGYFYSDEDLEEIFSNG